MTFPIVRNRNSLSLKLIWNEWGTAGLPFWRFWGLVAARGTLGGGGGGGGDGVIGGVAKGGGEVR